MKNRHVEQLTSPEVNPHTLYGKLIPDKGARQYSRGKITFCFVVDIDFCILI